MEKASPVVPSPPYTNAWWIPMGTGFPPGTEWTPRDATIAIVIGRPISSTEA